jgi:hypothetical protein
MRYTEERLRTEISLLLDGRQDRGEDLKPQWVTHEVCNRHRRGLVALDDSASSEEQDHVAFWEYSGYTHTRKLATRCINEREQPDRLAPSDVLPGFEYLNKYYVHQRDGVDVGVRIEDSTDDELLAKADLYETQSQRLVAHANELRRYVDWRRGQRSARATDTGTEGGFADGTIF